MKLGEKVVYSVLLFLFSYIVLSVGLVLFHWTSNYVAHMVGGIVGLGLGMILFMFLLIKKF